MESRDTNCGSSSIGRRRRKKKAVSINGKGKSTKRRRSQRRPVVGSLPGDLLIDVLARVASSSFTDLFNAKLWSVFTLRNCIKSRYFMAVFGRWVGYDSEFIFVNVYAPQPQSEKKLLWKALKELKDTYMGTWVFFGDFNVVRRKKERRNSIFCASEANQFNCFIHDAGLSEHNMGGRKFTYLCTDGMKLSKLDRFLVCSNFINTFPLASVFALPRETSDHSPIILKTSHCDFGPTPFRFFNSWLCCDGIDTIVYSSWKKTVDIWYPDLLLAKKLRVVKDDLRKWRNDMYLNENREVLEIKKRVESLETAAKSRSLCLQERKELLDGMKKLGELEKIKKMDLQQKAKVKWLVDGDENSSFFHGILNNKNRKNRIHGININGRWSSDPGEIKDEVFKFFEKKFAEDWTNRPKFICSNFKRLSQVDGEYLERPFDLEEIKSAVWECGNDRAPGPDGFTFKFIKHYWDLLHEDICKFVKHFEVTGRFNKGCNSSFITLIPKCKDPTTMVDFRPINLIGCMYKIITKLLALRLKTVVGKLVGEEQSAYIEGRYILDGPLVINELCAWVKSKKEKMFLFKVDFDKAFDSVNWGYLESTMSQMGFGVIWRSWIMGCLSSSRASVLVNGSPTREFQILKGVRQGDPLSPFLFIIAMEGLNVAIKSACEKSILKGISVTKEEKEISHLLYADDALFIGKWCHNNLKNLSRILRCFHVVSGLKVNFHKSNLYGIGLSGEDVQRGAKHLKCRSGVLPFKYLGVPVGENMSREKAWIPVIDKFRSKLSSWKAKHLSFGGRVTLIKSVLGNLPTYYFSLFKAPCGVIEKLDKIRRNFLWGGSDVNKKIKWVSWEKVVASKKMGGLGIGSLKTFNIALLLKWWWRLKSNPGAIWSKIINQIHKCNGKSWDRLALKSIKGTWSNIAKMYLVLENLGIKIGDILKQVVRRGDKTSFWQDIWRDCEPLKITFPNLYKLEIRKYVQVQNRCGNNLANWGWKRKPRTGVEMAELHDLEAKVGNFQQRDLEDVPCFMLSKDGVFDVRLLRAYLDEALMDSKVGNFSWSKIAPLKVDCFAWRLSLDRIPTKSALQARGVIISSSACVLCDSHVESSQHLFFDCHVTRELWRWTSKWCQVDFMDAKNWVEVISYTNTHINHKKQEYIRLMLVYGLAWNIWKARNEVVFKKRCWNNGLIMDSYLLETFTWMKNRGKMGNLKWEEWCINPLKAVKQV